MKNKIKDFGQKIKSLPAKVNEFFEVNETSFTRTLIVWVAGLITAVYFLISKVVIDIVGKITTVDEYAADIVSSVITLLGVSLGGLATLATLYQVLKLKRKIEEAKVEKPNVKDLAAQLIDELEDGD